MDSKKCKYKINICAAYIQINVLGSPSRSLLRVRPRVCCSVYAGPGRDTLAVREDGSWGAGTRVDGVDTLGTHRTVPPHTITGLQRKRRNSLARNQCCDLWTAVVHAVLFVDRAVSIIIILRTFHRPLRNVAPDRFARHPAPSSVSPLQNPPHPAITTTHKLWHGVRVHGSLCCRPFSTRVAYLPS